MTEASQGNARIEAEETFLSTQKTDPMIVIQVTPSE